MKVASALVRGNATQPELARDAVAQAMASAALDRVDHLFLFLSRDFARHAQAALVAAARAGGALAVNGMTASGLLTESGWCIDQPAAAALVIGELDRDEAPDSPLISFAGHGRMPGEWQGEPPRAGLVDSDAPVWCHGRLSETAGSTIRLPGLRAHVAHATGLRAISDVQPVGECRGFEVSRIGALRAQDSLRRALPPECRERMPLHQLSLIRQNGLPALAVLALGTDGAVLLAEPLHEGELVQWAIRQPLAAEHDMRACLNTAAANTRSPAFALMLSCIGRGPLFYGGDDQDLNALREVFPGIPVLGAYGTGQIVPLAGGNRLFHNSVLTMLFEKAHV